MIDLSLLDILAPGLVAGLIVLAAHAPLGIEVLKRGIVFIDLATAQVVGLALILLHLWLEDPFWMVHQGVSFGAGIAIALFFRWIERVSPTEQEAVIGSSFIVAASLGLLVLANDPHGGEVLNEVLFGQILFTSWGDIAAFLPVYALFMIAWFTTPRLQSGTGFFLLFALVITASVQLVGVYVVFASLILPALAARKEQGYILVRAYISGAVAVVAAILISAVMDLPAGPFLVLCFAISAIAMRVPYRKKVSVRSD